jgi:nitrite reductase/ring-hydroxylating ferredoxin subunit
MTDIDTTTWTRICAGADLDEASPYEAMLAQTPICLYRVNGAIYATGNVCSHGSAKLSDGDVEGYEIECPYHQGRFDIRTGAPTLTPCTVPITVYPAREADGAVWVRREDSATRTATTNDADG